MKHTIEKYSRSAILRLYIFRALGYFSCGECLEPFRAHPSLTSRSSPSSNNQSYRNLKLFLQQTAKIICSSAKLTYGLRLCVIPAVKDAVVPTVNAANPLIRDIKAKGLKRNVALSLWSGKCKTWGNVLGTTSKVPVHVYTRSDACGAAETWAAWFGKRQEDLEGTAVFGDPGVASAVQKDKVGIGFNNIAYAYDQKTRRPYAGLAIIPLDVNGNGKIDPEENFYDNSLSLIKAIVSGKYPSPPARNLFLVSNGVPKKPEVIEFIKYILTEGQKYANATGYIGLSKTTINQELAKLKK